MDKIICTQDIPGEREWVQSQFPGYVSLETEFGGKWPNNSFAPGASNYIWEIPVESTIALNTIAQEKILSVFSNSALSFIDHRWCDTNKLLSKLSFETSSLKNTAVVITHNRCGTVFLEKMIYNNYGYTKLRDHTPLGDPDINQQVNNLCNTHSPDVFVVYRNNLWDWITSYAVAKRSEYIDSQQKLVWVHEFNQEVLNSLNPFDITEDFVLERAVQSESNWNSICHLRTQFPNLNFFVLEFSYLTESTVQQYDSKIDYSKNNFIKNYAEMKEIFYQKYSPLMQQQQANAIRHLKAMNCCTDLNVLIN
jgi:hypothetical protein